MNPIRFQTGTFVALVISGTVLFSFMVGILSCNSGGTDTVKGPQGPSGGGGIIAGCPVFPADNIWNTPVDRLPVDAKSAAYITCMGADTGLHPDFGSGTWEGGPIGFPYITVPGTQPKVPIHFVEYGDESDPGPYPIPSHAPVEWGSDHHVLVLDAGNCRLYE